MLPTVMWLLFSSRRLQEQLLEEDEVKQITNPKKRMELNICERPSITNERERYQVIMENKKDSFELNEIKKYIYQSNKKKSIEIIKLLSKSELVEALNYLESVNINTPKNKTRPLIRIEINKQLEIK